MAREPWTIVLPTSREEVVALMWAHLKERLAARRAATALKQGNVPISLRRASGEVMVPIRGADVTLDADGWALVGDLVGAWSDDIRPREPQVVAMVLDHAYDLVRQGILRPQLGPHGLLITEHGARALEADDSTLPPGDPSRALAFRTEFAGTPDLDLVTTHYAEAISTYASGFNYSATVMIGVCYEFGILQIGRALVARQARTGEELPGLNKDSRRTLAKVADDLFVSAGAVEELVYEVLRGMGQVLEKDDMDWVNACFRSTSFFVRGLRNAAGHPTGRAIPRDDVAAHILMFPAFYRRVRSICSRLGTIPVSFNPPP